MGRASEGTGVARLHRQKAVSLFSESTIPPERNLNSQPIQNTFFGPFPQAKVNQRSITELRAELRAGARGEAERTQQALAEAVTAIAVREYWSGLPTRMPLLEPPTCGRTVAASLAGVAAKLGSAVTGLPVSEAAYHLSLLYTGLLLPEIRSKNGVHYTPPSLANRLLDQAQDAGLDWATATVLDPAAGAAAFLVPATERMLKARRSDNPRSIIQSVSARIHGYELDPFAAWLGQVFIEAAVLPFMDAAGERPSQCITVGDALKVVNIRPEYDLVIGNPPFGRQSLSVKQRSRFARSLYGHANLYGVFLDLAVEYAKPNGLVSFLTPSSFLGGEYFKKLRALLSTEAPPVSLDFVTARKGVFEDVLQETLLATYRRAGPQNAAAVSFIVSQPNSPAIPVPAGCFTLPTNSEAPWILPRHRDEEGLAARLRSMPCRLADWGYRVKTGPLVWNRFKSQLRDKTCKGSIPLVWAESITPQGKFIFRSERRNHKPYFRILPDDEWLVVRCGCVLLQRTTAKEQARRLIAAEMPAQFIQENGGVTVENHLNMLLPLSDKPSVSPALLAAFLNTESADRAFRCLSGSVAVSAYELENLPLPSPSELKKLVGRSLGIAAVEQASRRLYAGEQA